MAEQEKDPITGRNLNRLANYNGSEPITYRTDIDLSKIGSFGKKRQGSAGDTNLVDYTPSKYDNFITPNDLPNLENIRSNNQGILDSLGRSTANFIGKTAVNVVGGLAGTAYGAVDAIREGKLSNLWDNDLTTALDKASENIGDYFKVYKSGDYEESNFLAKAFLHPIQFTDETMDALSFTAGAVITEMASQGLASGVINARALKYLKGLSKVSEAAEVGAELGKGANLINKLSNAGTLTRQLATGAAYEAAIEARQASNQLRDKLDQKWLSENPGASLDQMPVEVRDSIDEKLSNAGLFTFMTNLALVGASNIIQFPKVFGAGYETANKAKNFENRIIRNIEGKYVDAAENASKFERGLSKTWAIAKNPIMEGIVEEGGQGVISGTAQDYFSRKGDKNAHSSVQDFLSDFGKNLIDTYTTKEGWNEIGMGMLIGSIGSPGRGVLSVLGKNNKLGQVGFNEDGTRRELWDGGIYGELRDRSEQTAEIASYIDDLNNSTSLMTAMKANYDFLVDSKVLNDRMDISLRAKDIFNYNNLKDDLVHSYITSRIKAGLSSDIDTTIDQLQSMSSEDLYTELKGTDSLEKASQEDMETFKDNVIDEFQKKAEATKKAYQVVDNAYQGDNEDIRDYFAHSIAKAEYADIREKAINQSLSDLTNGAITNINLRGTPTTTISNEIANIKESLKQEDIHPETKAQLNSILDAYNLVSDKNRNLTASEFDSFRLMAEIDPINLSLNIDKITSMLEDSRKLRAQRQEYISIYNKMFTKEGQNQVKKEQEAYDKLVADREKAIKEAEDLAKAEELRRAEEERIATRQSEIADKVNSAELKKNQVEESEIDDELSFGTATLLDENGDVILPEIVTEEVEEITPEEVTVTEIVNYQNNHNTDLQLSKDGLVRNKPSDSEEYKFIDVTNKREVGNTLISLNIDYVENILGSTKSKVDEYNIFDSYDENGKLVINSNFDSRLQDPNQFMIGTELNVIFPTYQQILDRGTGLQGYSENEYNNDINNIDSIPIAFTDRSGKILGFLPTRANVNRRVSPKFLEIELIKNKELRTLLFNNRTSPITIKITDKSSGTPMFQRNRVSIYDALGDGSKLAKDVNIGIYKEGKLQIGLNNVFKDNIKLPTGLTKDMYFQEGLVYAIVPTAIKGEYMALDMNVNSIGESRANDIIKILELYKASDKFESDKSLLEERDNLSVEADFSNFKEVSDILNNIIYIDNNNDNYMLRLDNKKLILGLTPDMQFTWNEFRNNSSVKDRVKDILSNRYNAVKLANFGTSYNTFSLNDNNQLVNTRYSNYFDYLNTNKAIDSNIQSEPVNNSLNTRYFTAQSVISLGDVNISPRQLTQSTEQVNLNTSEEVSNNDTTINTIIPEEAPKKPKNKLGLKKPSANRNKPRIDEDFSELVANDHLSLEQQAEELMKKCQ